MKLQLICAVLCVIFAAVQPKCVPDDYVVASVAGKLDDSSEETASKTIKYADLKIKHNYQSVMFVGMIEHLCKKFGKVVKGLKAVAVVSSPITTMDKGIFDGTHVSTLIFDDLELHTIETGSFQNMPELENFDMRSSPIKTVEDGSFKDLPQLSDLVLRDLEITTISPKWFENCPKINTVDFSYNEIRVIPTGTFSFMAQDQPLAIKLSHNKIRTIEAGAFAGADIQLLHLGDNHLQAMYPEMFTQLNAGNKHYLNLAENRFTCIDEKTLAVLKVFSDVNMEDNYPAATCDKSKATQGLKKFKWT